MKSQKEETIKFFHFFFFISLIACPFRLGVRVDRLALRVRRRAARYATPEGPVPASPGTAVPPPEGRP